METYGTLLTNVTNWFLVFRGVLHIYTFMENHKTYSTLQAKYANVKNAS